MPNLFYSFGNNDRPDHVEIDGREDKFTQDNYAYSGNSFVRYGGGAFPYPQLTPALLAQVNNIPALFASSYGEQTKIYSGQKKAVRVSTPATTSKMARCGQCSSG